MKALPLPIIDNSYPWNSDSCTKCEGHTEGKCYGHYSETMEENETREYAEVPTTAMEMKFKKDARIWTEEEVHLVAKDLALPPDVVHIYNEHLMKVKNNRIKGAAKAKETRAQNKINEIL